MIKIFINTYYRAPNNTFRNSLEREGRIQCACDGIITCVCLLTTTSSKSCFDVFRLTSKSQRTVKYKIDYNSKTKNRKKKCSWVLKLRSEDIYKYILTLRYINKCTCMKTFTKTYNVSPKNDIWVFPYKNQSPINTKKVYVFFRKLSGISK